MRTLTRGVTLTKTSNAAAFDQQAYSNVSFTGGAYASVRAASNWAMFGLNTDPLTDANYTSIDYAMYTDAANVLRIYESGSLVLTVGAWAVGDLLEVIYDNANVRYYQNGALLRTVARAAGATFFFDSSFYSTSPVFGTFTNVKFGPDAALRPMLYTTSAFCVVTYGEFENLTGPGYNIHVQSESQDADGTWQSHNTLQGTDWTTAIKYRGDADTPYVAATVELARSDRTLSMAPLMTGSTINRNAAAAYAPFLDAVRRIRVRAAIVATGVAPYLGVGGAWTFSGVTGGSAAVNDNNFATNVFHTDTAVAGAYVQVDMGAAVEFDQVRMWESTANAPSIWKVQGSADAATWIDIKGGFNPNKAGPNLFYFPRQTYRYWRLTLTNTPGAGSWTNEVQFNRDWREVFDGYIDKVGIGGRDDNSIMLDCRDLGAILVDTDIEVIRQYGSSAGTAVETVMQSILDDNLGAGVVTLYTPVSPNWLIHEFSQKLQGVMEGIRALAKQIGYEIRYVYDANNVLRLTFYAPDRQKVISDYFIGPSVYTDVTKLDVEGTDIRNAWTVEYIDRATGNKLTAIATSAPSIAQFKRRPARIAYGYSSNIDSATEAQKMVDAALADTAFPKAIEVVDLQYWPLVDIADLITFQANGEHYDNDQQRAVVAFEHDLRDGDGTTTLTTRGKPGGGYDTWMSMVGGMTEGPSLTVTDTVGGTPAANHSVAYTGSWDTIQLSIDGAVWIVPGASPLSVTPNPAGGAAKQYSFRAVKNGQIVTQTVYVATPPPLPPQAIISHLNTEVDDSVWNLTMNAVVGAGGGGANLTWAMYRKSGFATEVLVASGNATTLPSTQSVSRHPRSDTVVRLTVTDVITGLTDTARLVVQSARPELNNTGNPYRARPYDDGDYAPRSTTSTGFNLHTSIVDSRAYLVNNHYNLSVHTLTDTVDGAARFASPVLNATSDVSLVATGTAITLGGNTALAGPPSAWDNQVYSRDSYYNGAYAQVTVLAGAGPTMFGLNQDPTTNASYTSIDFAFYLTNSSGDLQIYEGGAGQGSFGTYATGDVLVVAYDGSTIRYMLNGIVVRSVYVYGPYRFYFDSSFHGNGKLGNIKFGPMSPSTMDANLHSVRGIQYNDSNYSLRSSSTDGRILLASDPYFSDTSQYVSMAYQRGYHNMDYISDSGTRFAAAQTGADKTSLNTAANITGQSQLATQGAITLTLGTAQATNAGVTGPPYNQLSVTWTTAGMPAGTTYDVTYDNGVSGGSGSAAGVTSPKVFTGVTFAGTPGRGVITVSAYNSDGVLIATKSQSRLYTT